MRKYLVVAVAGLILTLAVSLGIAIRIAKKNAADRDRLQENQTVLYQQASYYRTQNDESVATIGRLLHTTEELKQNKAELVKTIQDLNIKLNRVQSTSTTATQTTYQITAEIKDSIQPPTPGKKQDTLHCITYADRWVTVTGCAERGNFTGTITSRDTIVQIAHRVPRKFLFIKYGTKGIRQTVLTKNPHATIVYTEYIELKK